MGEPAEKIGHEDFAARQPEAGDGHRTDGDARPASFEEYLDRIGHRKSKAPGREGLAQLVERARRGAYFDL